MRFRREAGDDERHQGKGVCPQEVQVACDFGVAGSEPEEEDARACEGHQREKDCVEDQHLFPDRWEQGDERRSEDEDGCGQWRYAQCRRGRFFCLEHHRRALYEWNLSGAPGDIGCRRRIHQLFG